MKLLKLVPENTNLDFMRWRNLALMLSHHRDRRLDRFHRLPRAQSRHRLRRRSRWSGPSSPSRSTSTTSAPASTGSASAKRASRRSATTGPIRSGSQARRSRDGVQRDGQQAYGRRSRSTIAGARVDAGESVSGKVSEELAQDSAMAIGSRCSASRSTSGSALNGSSASAHCSRSPTTSR